MVAVRVTHKVSTLFTVMIIDINKLYSQLTIQFIAIGSKTHHVEFEY